MAVSHKEQRGIFMNDANKGCRIKICGLSRIGDMEAVNRVRPDYIGFVFAQSRRQVGATWAASLKRALDPRIQAVGVFVNAPVSEAVRLAEVGTIQMIQLHGDEDEAYIRELKRQTAAPVMKAVRVRNGDDILRAEQLSCEYLLLDTYTKGQYGGSGRVFDWNLIPPLQKPFFLAGGISMENVHEAQSCRPYCLDVSSAVETEGRKDPEKIRRMVEAVRQSGKQSGG